MDEHNERSEANAAATGAGSEQEGMPLNREQRRAQRFGRHGNDIQDNLLPQSRNNPAFGSEGEDEAYAGQPDEGVTRLTGAGTGGATESDGRLVHHEGMHLGNEPNS